MNEVRQNHLSHMVTTYLLLSFDRFPKLLCTDPVDEKEPVEDSIVTSSDNGRAQFPDVTVDTFAIRQASSLAASA